ncbi:MAG: LysE family translocator [Alphaproteobacteria bacterium]|nr:LysE family translocator [Alphaproteobacteria bacterium]MBU1575004.1 LysE family translocator [Alphaproteobacteria bacterium]MBU2079069.1 LysE family translocator [Alphaproteobacteria bacterium]MBU2159742.1 LysE family translocator [Alphaproteobacteria bacterium]MBU2243243.1 LysE family translocator [Alphaproteobacteria bacterium]
MDMTLFIALLAFAFVSSVTPGPNNLMLLASGANFGLRRTLPHMFGVSLGHSFMVFIVGLGLAQMFQAYPPLRQIMLVASIAYMSWLAWKIAHARAPEGGKVDGTPLTFLQAAAFQWVNPKGWIMAIGAQTNYAQDTTWVAALMVGLGFLIVNFPAITLWAWLGQEMRRFLTNRRRLTAFNWTMAALLLASLIPILFH